jgi:hypothetical protein
MGGGRQYQLRAGSKRARLRIPPALQGLGYRGVAEGGNLEGSWERDSLDRFQLSFNVNNFY